MQWLKRISGYPKDRPNLSDAITRLREPMGYVDFSTLVRAAVGDKAGLGWRRFKYKGVWVDMVKGLWKYKDFSFGGIPFDYRRGLVLGEF